jgi:NAD(P)-dependent dehydrogenase (short-subunit alcohol dehydrogenase family)
MAKDQIAIVTGAYGAIGKAIARQMAERGYSVVLAGRHEDKLQLACGEILKKTGNQDVRYEVVDLALKKSIKEMAGRWKGPLHVLINNAVTAPWKRTETEEGIEEEFATNVLGYFHMIRFFTEFLKEAGEARVVNVASYWAGDLDMNDLEFRKRKYNNDTAYRQSKQANRMLTVAFAERLKDSGITVNSCHPGDVNSKVSNCLGYGGHETPDEGAATPIWLATDPSLGNTTGKYFAGKSEAWCQFSQDAKGINKLFSLCESY